MAGRLCDILPDVADLMRLKPEELAGPVLETLHFQAALSSFGLVQGLDGYLVTIFALRAEQYSVESRREVERAITEAWFWLRHQGFLAPDVHNPGYEFITRRGQAHKTQQQLASYRKGLALPWELVHHSIRDKVWSTFLRGDHDTAIFQAFKEVEVAVRMACCFADDLVGVHLMRKAFAPKGGPLSDQSALPAEQEALMHLFAGSIGSYKNPHSHRHVGVPSGDVAAEMIILASHLLTIVGSRTASAST